MERHLTFSVDDIETMVHGDDHLDSVAATRKIWAEWELFDEEGKKRLIKLAKELHNQFKQYKDHRDAWQYMLALGTLDYQPALPEIYDTLQHSEDENQKGFAADALARYTTELPNHIQQYLWELIEQSDSLVVRVNSVRAVSLRYYRSANKEISRKLFEQLDHQENSVIRNTIMIALANVGSMELVPDLIHMMITRRTEADKKAAGQALDTIAQINGFDDREALIKQIN